MLSALVSGLGALFGAQSNRKAQKMATAEAAANRAATATANARALAYQREANRATLADKAQDRAMQREFAKSGIQWRVEDATRAGIHPVYAIGAQGASYSPSAVQVGAAPVAAETAVSDAPRYMAAQGQDISRAVQATSSIFERENAFQRTAESLQLSKLGLENQLLAAQIAKFRGQVGPPMPGGSSSSSASSSADKLTMGGFPVKTAKNTAGMQEWSDRYGDEGLASWLIPPMIMWHDYQATVGGEHSKFWSKAAEYVDRNVKVGVPSWNPFRRSPGAGRFGYDGRTGGSF